MGMYYIGLLSLVGINSILVVSLNITNGYTGLFSLALGGLIGIGAYASGLLTLSPEYKMANLPKLPDWLINTQWSLLPALLVGAVLAVVIGTLFTWPSLRLKGHYLALASLAFSEIIRLLASNMQDVTRGAKSLTGIASLSNLWWIYGFLVVEVLLTQQLFKIRHGEAMIAIREDDTLAQLSGVNLTKYKIYSFMISAFFAGAGGALWVHYTNIVSPGSFRLAVIFTLFIMFTIGGQGSISGAIIGATIITLLPQILRPLEEGGTIVGIDFPQLYGLTQIIMAVFLVVLLIKRPFGIMGYREFSLRDLKKLLRKLLHRNTVLN
jgi:branched-chain amino acid transport system permease protein